MPRKKKPCPICGVLICGESKTCRNCRTQSEETKAKMSKSNKRPWLGKNLSEEHKKRIKESLPKGDKHKKWKGAEAGYMPIHQWVGRSKGKPSYCEHCGSVEKGKHVKYEWANIDHKYERNLDDYIRLCTSCHRKYDIEMGFLRVVFDKKVGKWINK